MIAFGSNTLLPLSALFDSIKATFYAFPAVVTGSIHWPLKYNELEIEFNILPWKEIKLNEIKYAIMFEQAKYC